MAKFRKLLFGSIIGAGLAYIFTRKDVRQRLMGGGPPQLPQQTGEYFGAGAAPAPAALKLEAEEEIRQAEAVAEPEAEPVEPEATVEAEAAPTEPEIAEEVLAPEVILEEEAVAPKAEEPVAETEAAAPAVEEPVLEAEKTVTESAEADEFEALKTPIEGEPSLEEQAPAEEPTEPAAGGPAPSQIDRDEMRRRIDETRARLKAKAFDAMISGESYQETEGEELMQRPEEGGLDKELENQIDQSLKEQD